MATQILTKFTLKGIGFDPDEITTFLGIQPTELWRRGAQIPKTRMLRKHDAWILSTGYEELDEEHAISVMQQASRIMERLKPHTAKLQEISTRLKLNPLLSCVLYVEDSDRPSVQFDSDIVQWLAELHAAIDVDLYYLSSENE